jgi:hypothetical protein
MLGLEWRFGVEGMNVDVEEEEEEEEIEADVRDGYGEA